MPASMLGVLVVTAVVMQLGRGETMTVNPAGMKAQGIDPDNAGEFSLGLTLEYGKPGLRPLVAIPASAGLDLAGSDLVPPGHSAP
ncbi:hypothetical protein [Streptomyces mirabilis]|uniref:hypothetical protein n=2 Tax=Streptomyces mirabilis TaxID=68239 RepID=UPI00364AB347